MRAPYTTSRLGSYSISYEPSRSLLSFICPLEAEEAAGGCEDLEREGATRLKGPGAPDCCVERSSSPLVSHGSKMGARNILIQREAPRLWIATERSFVALVQK